MTDPAEIPGLNSVLIVLGCPEIPVQQALALHIAHNFRKRGTMVHAAGNPAVLNLLRVSDPERRYLPGMNVLEKCIGEIIGKTRECDICVVFAHSDAGISYAATMRHLLPASQLVTIIFGKNAESLAALVEFPCEKIVERAVHNPMQLMKKINEAFGWAV